MKEDYTKVKDAEEILRLFDRKKQRSKSVILHKDKMKNERDCAKIIEQ